MNEMHCWRTWFRLSARLCVAIFLPLLSASANAAYTCTGPVTGVALGPTGVVTAGSMGGFNWVYLCSINTNYNGVTPDICKGMYSMLLTAQVTGKKVTLWFNDEPNTCASHPGWAQLTGWYFGPMLQD